MCVVRCRSFSSSLSAAALGGWVLPWWWRRVVRHRASPERKFRVVRISRRARTLGVCRVCAVPRRVGVGAVTHSASPTCHNFVSRVMRSRNPAIKVYLSNISGRTFTRREKCITVRLGASDPNTMDCGDPGAHALYLSWHRREHIQRLRTHARHEDGPNRMCVRRGATRERGGRYGAARQPVSVGSHLSSAGMCASREAWCDDRRTSRRRRLSRQPRWFPPRRPGWRAGSSLPATRPSDAHASASCTEGQTARRERRKG